MFDFICMGQDELRGMQSKQKCELSAQSGIRTNYPLITKYAPYH